MCSSPKARLLAAALALVASTTCARDRSRGGEITLRVLNWATDLEVAAEQRVADQFSSERPGVRVIVESIVTNYGEKLITAIASGVPPDVFLLDAPDIPTFVERGLVLDLTPYLSRVGYDTGAVFPEVLNVFSRGQRLYALPKGFSPLVMYYNRTLFHDLDVPTPPDEGWTWDEFLATARAVTRDMDGDGRTDIYAVNFPRRLYEWIPWVWSAGGDILSPEGTQTVGYLDSERTVETFEFLTSLITEWRVVPPIQFLREGDPMLVGRFYIGKQAMLLSGHWHLPRLLDYAAREDLDIGIAPIPRKPGAEYQTVIYASGWAVPSSVRHKRLAVELAGFLAGEEAQWMRAKSRLEISASHSVAAAVAESDTLGVERAFLRQVEYGRIPWGARVMDFHEIEEMSLDIMDSHILRGKSLQTAATDVARRIDRVIAR